MADNKLDKETKKAIMEAKTLIEAIVATNGNEAETRSRLEKLFESVLGYDIFKHISRESAMKGSGDSGEYYCDFAIHIEEGEKARAEILVEIKRVNVDLAAKHLKQVSTYAITNGCEWIILTNGKVWQLHHVSFGQPPETKIISEWDLIQDSPEDLADSFELISYKNVKRGGLKELWQKANVLTPRKVLEAIVSEDSIKVIRRELRKSSGILISPPEVLEAIRGILNADALSEMETIKFGFRERKSKKHIEKNPQTEDQAKPEEVLNVNSKDGGKSDNS